MFADRLASTANREAAINALRDFFKHAELATVADGGHTFKLMHAGFLGVFQIFPPDSIQAKALGGGGKVTAESHAQASINCAHGCASAAPAAPADAQPTAPSIPVVPVPSLPHLTPTDKLVLPALDPNHVKDVDAIQRRTGRSAGRIRESLTRWAHHQPPYVVKIGEGYRLTPEGLAVAKKIEEDEARQAR